MEASEPHSCLNCQKEAVKDQHYCTECLEKLKKQGADPKLAGFMHKYNAHRIQRKR